MAKLKVLMSNMPRGGGMIFSQGEPALYKKNVFANFQKFGM